MSLTYTLPAARVFELFNVTPSVGTANKSACIIGGHAQLVRYAQPAETELGFLGYYDPSANHAYAWPNLSAAAIVDPTYSKLFVKDALLQYSQHYIGGGANITKTANYSNRISAPSLFFGTNAAGARSAEFYNRDVQVGDIAVVRGVTGGTSYSLTTYVQSLLSTPTSAVVGTPAVDPGNPTTQSAATTVTQTAGTVTAATLAASASAYSGLISGFANETYTAIVTQGSTGGVLTTALLRIVSASGTDDVASVAPGATTVAFNLGTRGATATFTSSVDLVVGQTWQVVVTGPYTAPVPTVNSTYTGTAATTYIATVTRGGLFSSGTKPQITASTSTGSDFGGPVNVTAAATFAALGNFGLQIKFSGTGLRLGDKFEVTVTPATAGQLNGIALGHSLNPALVGGTELDLTLYIRQPLLAVTANNYLAPPLTNWTQDGVNITVASGLQATDPSMVNSGVPVPLPVVSIAASSYGRMYAEYRAWLPTLASSATTVTDIGSLSTAIPGPLSVDNRLAYGVAKALGASNGQPVLAIAVANPADLNSWIAALGVAASTNQIGCIAPTTRDPAVLALVQAHVDAMSSADNGLRRTAAVCLTDIPKIPVVSTGSTVPNYSAATTSDAALALGTVTAVPGGSSTVYTRLSCTSLNSLFLTNGVRPLDTLRIGYTTDGFTGTAWSEYAVASVTSESELLLVAGPASQIASAVKFEIWRTLTTNESAVQIGKSAGAFGDHRIVAMWPDQIEDAGVLVPGFYASCAFAGLRSGVLPQQGLTKVTLPGFTAATRSTRKFTRAQLDAMAVAGTLIITQAPDTGAVYIRQAITTASYANLSLREEMITRNFDSVADYMQQVVDPYIGVTNVTPTNQATIQLQLDQAIVALSSLVSASASIGPQMLPGSNLVSLDVDPVNADRYIASILCVLPSPLNNIDVYLTLQI